MRKMKDSGIEWIGEIPDGWEISRLKNIADVTMGQSPESEEYNLDGIGAPFLQGNADFTEKFPRERVYCTKANKFSKAEDILLSVRAPVGAKNVSDKIYAIGRGICSISCVKIMPQIIWHFIDILNNEFDTISNGSTYDSVTINDVRNSKTIIIPLTEQQAIATYLDTKCTKIDSTIEKEKLLIEKLKEYKQSVITEAVTKGLDPNAKMKDSGIEWIGEVPEGWEKIKIKQLLKSEKNAMRVGPFGSQMKDDKSLNSGYTIFNQRTVLDNDFENGESFVDEQMYNDLLNFKLNPLDILITTRGTIGKIAVAPECIKEGIIHSCIIKFSINRNLINDSFLRYIFNDTRITLEQLILESNATTIPVIYSEPLRNLKISLPSLQKQAEIVKHLDTKCSQIDKSIKQKQKLIEKLAEYKKSLIYEVVTGKIEV